MLAGGRARILRALGARSDGDADGSRSQRARWIDLLVAGLLALLLHGPSLSVEELHDEEGRRLLPAREMVASGDYVVPTIWGRPYLAKPPLYFWCVVAAGRVTGELGELEVRLPALVATVLTSLALVGLGARLFGRRAGLLAGLVWPLTFATFDKATLGELEAPLALTVLLSTGLLVVAARGSWPAALGAGVALAASLLTKGPVALLFLAATAGAIALAERRWRFLASGELWLAVALGIGLSGVWVALLLQRLDVAETLALWREELDRGAATGLGAFLGKRLGFLGSVALGFLPGTLVLLCFAGSAEARAPADRPDLRTPSWILALGLSALVVSGAVEHRYAYPLAPWCALASGVVLDRCLAHGPTGRASSRLRLALAPFALIGVALGLAALLLQVHSLGELHSLDALGWALAALGTCAGAFLALRWRRASAPALLVAGALVIGAVRLVQRTQIVPAGAHRNARMENAARIEAALPSGEPLYTTLRTHYNLLAYLQRPVHPVASPADIPVGAPALVHSDSLAGRDEFEPLLELTLRRRSAATLARRRAP